MTTEQWLLASDADPSLAMGMPLPFALALMALASSVVTAIVTALVKKFRSPTDDREDKVVVLDASDKLIQRFQQIVKDSDEKHANDIAALSREVGELRQELELVKQERTGLIKALRQLVQMVRRYAGHDSNAEAELQAVLDKTGLTLTLY